MDTGTDPLTLFKEQLAKEHARLKRLNLAVIGATGAGKSTLINAMFREEVAATGNGRPVTTHTTRYEREGVPLTLYDTKGVELGDAAPDIKAELRELVLKSRTANVEDHIHAVWYCIRSSDKRLEDFQGTLIASLADLGLPVILVFTQCLGPDHEPTLEFASAVQDMQLPTTPREEVILTLARPERIGPMELPAFGLERLLDVTLAAVPEAVQGALVNAQQVDLKLKEKRARKELAGFVASAFGVGFAPVPFADVALLIPIQVGMLARICAAFGITMNRDTTKALVLAVTGTGGAAAAGKYLATQLLKLVPGANAAAGFIRGGVAASMTTALGEAYILACREILRRESQGLSSFGQEELVQFVLQAYKDALPKVKGSASTGRRRPSHGA